MAAQDDVLQGLEERYQLYLGIPRQMIPWFPEIDETKCVGCKECMTFCHDSVYTFNEETHQVIVESPWHCQVYCQSCTHACDQDAISFKDRREVKSAIRALREKYPPQ